MNNILVGIYLALFISMITTTPLSIDNVVTAIDCGSSRSYQSPDGFTYLTDDHAHGDSRVADYTQDKFMQNEGLKFTLDPVVFTTERHGENFSYDLYLDGQGNYTFILQFVELWFEKADQRVFDILLGETIVRKDFSILANVPMRGFVHHEYMVFELKGNDQIITDTGLVCKNAYSSQTSKITLQFRQGLRDLPKIDAIILVRGGLSESNYDEHQTFIQNWDEYERLQKEVKAKEKELRQLNSDIEAIEIVQDESDGLVSLLFSWIGLSTFMVIAVFLGCLCLTDNKKKQKKSTKKTK